jgi:hypothetical protein
MKPDPYVERARAHQRTFALTAREWEREDFVEGETLARRWEAVVASSADVAAAVALFLDVNRVYVKKHLGASGWGALRNDVACWLARRIAADLAAMDDERFRQIAGAFVELFDGYGASDATWQACREGARAWLAAVGGRGEAARTVGDRVLAERSAQLAGAAGFPELVRVWVSYERGA